MKDSKDLQNIPGIGKSMAADLKMLGIRQISDLAGKSPEKLYGTLCAVTGTKQDRCVLYVFRCAVYYAQGGRDEEKLKWWNWKDERG